MSDYKNTLNLPRPTLRQKAISPSANRNSAALGGDGSYARLRRSAGVGALVRTTVRPMPTADPHRYAVNKILKDIIVKARTLDGFDAPHVPGWDCHGLPIDQRREAGGQAGAEGRCVVSAAPAAITRSSRSKSAQRFPAPGRVRRLNRPCPPWIPRRGRHRARPRPHRRGGSSIRVSPVHWCLTGPAAEAEVEYEDRTSPAIDVR